MADKALTADAFAELDRAVFGDVASAEKEYVFLVLVGTDDFFVHQQRLILEAGRHAHTTKGASHEAQVGIWHQPAHDNTAGARVNAVVE